jgi:hypothetical protein
VLAAKPARVRNSSKSGVRPKPGPKRPRAARPNSRCRTAPPAPFCSPACPGSCQRGAEGRRRRRPACPGRRSPGSLWPIPTTVLACASSSRSAPTSTNTGSSHSFTRRPPGSNPNRQVKAGRGPTPAPGLTRSGKWKGQIEGRAEKGGPQSRLRRRFACAFGLSAACSRDELADHLLRGRKVGFPERGPHYRVEGEVTAAI